MTLGPEGVKKKDFLHGIFKLPPFHKTPIPSEEARMTEKRGTFNVRLAAIGLSKGAREASKSKSVDSFSGLTQRLTKTQDQRDPLVTRKEGNFAIH